MAGRGRRRGLCGDTLSMSCASLRRLRRPCSPCAPSVPPWTSPCSLCPVCQKAPCKPAFHFKYRAPPSLTQSSSLLGVSHLGMLACVYVRVCPKPSKPLSLPDDSQAWTCLFSGHKADLQGASQGLSLLCFQMLISMHPSGISRLLTSSHVCCVIFLPSLKVGLKQTLREVH